MTPEEKAERRQFLRIPVAAKVKFRDGGREEVWFTEDLGEGGLFLKTDRPPFVGTQLDLEISIPHVDELVQARGEVMWRHEGRGCGVRFIRCTHKMRNLLREYLEKTSPEKP